MNVKPIRQICRLCGKEIFLVKTDRGENLPGRPDGKTVCHRGHPEPDPLHHPERGALPGRGTIGGGSGL